MSDQPFSNVQRLAEGRYLRLLRRDGWEYIERPTAGAVVAIVALNDDGAMVLIEQYRIPVQGPVIEIPAGLADEDDAGAGLVAVANRELLEETGYRAASMTFLTRGPTSAGQSNEVVDFFRAEGLCRVGPGGGTGHSERILVHEVPLPQVPGWLQQQGKRGALIDPKIYTGLYFLHAGTPYDTRA